VTAATPLEAALEEWVSRTLAGEVLDLPTFAREKGVSAEALATRVRTIDWMLERHRSARGTSRDTPGGVLDRYRLGPELGRGGQGVVHVAEDTLLDRRVALKLLTALARASPQALARLRREATVAARLDHPAACPVYDLDLEGEVPYIAMALIEGESLAASIARAREAGRDLVDLPGASPGTWGAICAVLSVGETIARALHAAHERGVVHRDVKPGNVMVTPAGRPVVLDFGLAADLGDDQPTLTAAGDVLGTPAYMSPEQLRGSPAVIDGRTDTFSFGITLFECLTLTRPFDAPTREGIYRAILTEEPPDPRRLNPALTADIKVVLFTALDKEPARRYATALDLAEDLRRVQAREPIRARPAGPALRLRRWAERNPTVAALVVLVFVLLVAGLAVSQRLLAEARRAERVTHDALEETKRERDQKEAALVEWNRLADLKRLKDLDGWAGRLWPTEPEQVGGPKGMDAWLAEANAVLGRGPEHREAKKRLAAGTVTREPPEFADPADGARYEALTELVALLERLPAAIRKMARRRDFAANLDRVTIDERRAEWKEAIAYADGRRPGSPYRGVGLTPQRGLIPLGADPASHLLEFSHLETGSMPERDPATGRFRINRRTGIVLVLLPGGRFHMGASPDPSSIRHDLEAQKLEAPVNEVALAPFFLSKYELTQSQWIRIMERNPSVYHPGRSIPRIPLDLTHPVESVTYFEAQAMLRRLAFVLPTEAQWEYACRAGTTTPWNTGETVASLVGHANIADEGSRAFFPAGWRFEPGFRDGCLVHAPVGRFLPNAFGLHDMPGNVAEWCRDELAGYASPARDGDGFRPLGATDLDVNVRVIRGGSFNVRARWARSSDRWWGAPTQRLNTVGLRPARALRK